MTCEPAGPCWPHKKTRPVSNTPRSPLEPLKNTRYDGSSGRNEVVRGLAACTFCHCLRREGILTTNHKLLDSRCPYPQTQRCPTCLCILPILCALRQFPGHWHGTHGLVAMTSAQHAEGRQFDPGWVYPCNAPAYCIRRPFSGGQAGLA